MCYFARLIVKLCASVFKLMNPRGDIFKWMCVKEDYALLLWLFFLNLQKKNAYLDSLQQRVLQRRYQSSFLCWRE